ncbi:MAG TPA: peptidase MA family metallohydrolase [Anaerolineae bacterium]|nr:peptidase MA family metallohydrolase [Anaerolineae bacterium]
MYKTGNWRLVLGLVVIWLVMGGGVTPVWGMPGAQSEPVVSTVPVRVESGGTYAFGQSLTFWLEVEGQKRIEGVTLFIGAATLPNTYATAVPLTPGQTISVNHQIDISAASPDRIALPLAPFATVRYWWYVHYADGSGYESVAQTLAYDDDQFAWQMTSRGGMTAYWTGDEAAIGQWALDVAEQAEAELAGLVPGEAKRPLRIYIYPSSSDLRAALRLTGRDWVGGHAAPELGVIMVTAVNPRTALADLQRSIPHEMAHLFIYEAAGIGFRNVPRWFDEGVASLAEAGGAPGYERALAEAVARRETLPLAGLCARLPVATEEVVLAYGQSRSLLAFIEREYGRQKIGEMVLAWADGANCDTAVRRSLGLTLAQLEEAWLQSLYPRPWWQRFWGRYGIWFILLFLGGGLSGLLVWPEMGVEEGGDEAEGEGEEVLETAVLG